MRYANASHGLAGNALAPDGASRRNGGFADLYADFEVVGLRHAIYLICSSNPTSGGLDLGEV